MRMDIIQFQGFPCVRFPLPESYCGRTDVIIHVEYAPPSKESDRLLCRAWMQVGNHARIRALLADFYVPRHNDPTQIGQRIVNYVSRSPAIKKAVMSYIAAAVKADPRLNSDENKT